MVAAFLEVHHDVEQRDGLCSSRVQLLEVSGQDPAIVLPGKEEGGVCVCEHMYTASLHRYVIQDHSHIHVHSLLHCTQLDTNNELSLGRYILVW